MLFFSPNPCSLSYKNGMLGRAIFPLDLVPLMTISVSVDIDLIHRDVEEPPLSLIVYYIATWAMKVLKSLEGFDAACFCL